MSRADRDIERRLPRDSEAVTSDYQHLTQALADSIRLGYEVEANDPNIAFEPRPDDEVRRLARKRGLDSVAYWPHDGS